MRLDDAALGGVWRCRSCQTIIVLPETLEPVRRRSARPVSASESGLFDRLEGSDFTETAGLSGLFDRPASATHGRGRASDSGLLDRSAALSGVIQTEPEEQLARASQAQRRPLPPPRSSSGNGAMVAVAVIAMVIIFGLIVALLATNRETDVPVNVAKNNTNPSAAAQAPQRNLSMADYRGAIPDADSDFLIEMMNKDTSLDQAKAEWAHRLKAAMARKTINPEPDEPPAPTGVAKAPTLIPAPEPKPATTVPDNSRRALSLEELRAAFPQADDDFLIAQMRRDRNIDEARAAWGRKLRGEPEPIEVVKRPTPAPAATVVPPRNPAPDTTAEPKPTKVAVVTPAPAPTPTPQPTVLSTVEIAKLHANAVKLMEQLRAMKPRYRLQKTDPAAGDPTVHGRYINIDLPNGKIVNGKKILALAEVQVFTGAVNIAPNGKATQSSTYEEAVARLAIDNNTSGDLEKDRTVAHTLGEADPRWELDLGADTEITAISIWNRTDNHSDRLDGYRVTVLDKARQPVWQVNVRKAPLASARFELYNDQALAAKAQMVFAGNPPRDGLVGYWKLDGSAADDSGNDRGGLFKGDPSLAEAKVGSGSITLDGRDDHIVIGKAVGLPNANHPQSIALWYMVPANPPANALFRHLSAWAMIPPIQR